MYVFKEIDCFLCTNEPNKPLDHGKHMANIYWLIWKVGTKKKKRSKQLLHGRECELFLLGNCT